MIGRIRRHIGLVALLALLADGPSLAQHQVTGPGPGVPPLPTGDATLTGRVLHADGHALPGLDVALYALAPDGRPGIGGTETDEGGRFRFEGISGEPGVVYLLGVRHQEVPFGQRAAFAEGQTELSVDLTVSDPVRDASALLVLGTLVQTEWVGAQPFVQIVHRIRNPDDVVVFVPEAERGTTPPVFRAALPPHVSEFVDGQSAMAGGFTRDGDALAFHGPIYPGDQELRYGFLLDVPDVATDGGNEEEAEEGSVELALPFPAGSGGVSLMIPESDSPPTGDRMPETFTREELEGQPLHRYELGGVAPGGVVTLSLVQPPSSSDVEGLRIARADYWVDHDDTAMRITTELDLRVDAPTRLMAPPGEALLRIDLPDGAEFLGLSASARALGVVIGDSGDLEVRGPLPPGESSLGWKYRVPVQGAVPHLDLTFERPVASLNLLVADNGVAIETDRLHRRRPFKQGTRIYLHNEAYQVAAGERVEVVLRPVSRRALPRTLALGGGLAAAALASFFLVGPLRNVRAEHEPEQPEETALGVERASLYASIRDLEHDHETGKIDTADFERMHAELRREAIELLRLERSGGATPAPPEAAARCPGCQATVESAWQFCSHCGHDLRRGGGGSD